MATFPDLPFSRRSYFSLARPRTPAKGKYYRRSLRSSRQYPPQERRHALPTRQEGEKKPTAAMPPHLASLFPSSSEKPHHPPAPSITSPSASPRLGFLDTPRMDGKEVGRPPNPSLPYREDCWSEGATSALIDAWGERFLDLNRGNLRQKQWQEVADAVNSRRTAVRRPPRSDIQCKNRIDTLKKKYKAEKARITNSGGALSSQWNFFGRLDSLIGSSDASSRKPSPPPAFSLPLPFKKSSMAACHGASREKRRHSLAEEPTLLSRKYSAAAAAAAAAAAERKDGEAEAEAESSKSSTERPSRRGGGPRRGGGGDGGEEGDDAEAVRELARAILRFGEVYEKVEREKQKQMMELEKERMEFTKGLEFQRMQIFVDCQLQLEKAKRAKRDPSDSYL